MIATAPVFTEAGRLLRTQALAGRLVTFTGFKVGNGNEPVSVDPLTDLVSPKLSFGITESEAESTEYFRVTGNFDTTMVEEAFKLLELGLFAEGSEIETFSGDGSTTAFTLVGKPDEVGRCKVGGVTVTISDYDSDTGVVTLATAPAVGTNNVVFEYADGNPVLYCYSYDSDGEMLVADASDVTCTQTVSILVVVGDAEQVTARISSSALYASKTDFDNHVGDHGNPHQVTKAQVGLGNVPNVTTNNQTPTYTVATTLAGLASGETLSVAFGKIAKAINEIVSIAQNLTNHINNKSNPHAVTKAQVGLGNVPNVTTNNQTPTFSQASTLENINSGENLQTIFGKIKKAIASLISLTNTVNGHTTTINNHTTHVNSRSNPHQVTADQIGLTGYYKKINYDCGIVSVPALNTVAFTKTITQYPGFTPVAIANFDLSDSGDGTDRFLTINNIGFSGNQLRYALSSFRSSGVSTSAVTIGVLYLKDF